MTRYLRDGVAPAALLIFATVPAATAQEAEPFALDEIVIETTRTGATESAIPGAVQVVPSEDIERRVDQGQSLERIVSDSVPGLAPSNGTIGGASQTLRGRTPQILVDGVARTSELRGFDRELSLIPPASIERIEIVKGSSARFGNGATGGIINIITKAPAEGTRTVLDTRLTFSDEDADDSLGAEVSIATGTRLKNGLGLRFELSGETMGDRFDGGGDRIPSDPLVGQGSSDNFDQYALGLAMDYATGPHEVSARLDAYSFEQDIDQFTDYTTDPVSVDRAAPYTGEPVEDETLDLTATYRHTDLAFGELEVTAYATDTTRRAAFVEAGAANPLYYAVAPGSLMQEPDSQTELETETYGVKITMRSPLDGLISGAQLTYGIDYGHDEVSQTTVGGDDVIAPMTQNSIAAFAQLDAPVGERFDLSAGVRAERFDLEIDDFTRPDAVQLTATGAVPLPAVSVTGGDYDYDAVVGNIGGVYHATPALDLFAGISQGFSVPDVGSFTRRAMPANPTAPGQTVSFADIDPEAQVVSTLELGTRYTAGPLDLSASAFVSASDEGTVFDPATNAVTQQEERIWGSELTLDYAVREDWNMGVRAAYTEGRYDADEDGDIDSWLPNNRIVSPFTATVYSEHAFASGLSLSGEVVYAAKRTKGDHPDVPDNVRVNVGGAYPVGRGQMTFGVTNLFDTEQDNATASTVRRNPVTGEAIRVADEGRRLALGYEVTF